MNLKYTDENNNYYDNNNNNNCSNNDTDTLNFAMNANKVNYKLRWPITATAITKRNTNKKFCSYIKKVCFHINKICSHIQKNIRLRIQKTHGKFLRQIPTANSCGKFSRQIATANSHELISLISKTSISNIFEISYS